MDEYLVRLCHSGLSVEQAYSVYINCMIEGGYQCIEEYLAELENEDVD